MPQLNIKALPKIKVDPCERNLNLGHPRGYLIFANTYSIIKITIASLKIKTASFSSLYETFAS